MRDSDANWQKEIMVIVLKRFEGNPICGVEELEDHVYNKMKRKLTKEDFESLGGKNRLRWQNDLDWVKATLTRRGQTRYININGERCLWFVVTVGWLEKGGTILTESEVWRVLTNLTERYSTE